VDAGNKELHDSLQALGLSSLVRLLGERIDVRAIYSALDIYCSPSINEGFPNVISEAMSMGLMCVVTDTGASQRLVGKAGISVPPGDVDALAKGLTKAIEMGADRRRSLGLRARRNIVENYSMASTVSDICLCMAPLVVELSITVWSDFL
jgi:glycosyltransferase involved in cell wall biosynthesis